MRGHWGSGWREGDFFLGIGLRKEEKRSEGEINVRNLERACWLQQDLVDEKEKKREALIKVGGGGGEDGLWVSDGRSTSPTRKAVGFLSVTLLSSTPPFSCSSCYYIFFWLYSIIKIILGLCTKGHYACP